MPVYNSAKYLKEAIDSILNQTFNDFEFLIIDDVSTDNSLKIIKSYNDDRIRIIINTSNEGQSYSMNLGLKNSRGKYIAIMHSDDISLPYRLEKQLLYMEANNNIGVCGSWIELIGENKGILQLETENDLIKIKLFTNQNLAHPSVMIRKHVLKKYNLYYNTEFIIAQDYDLWVKMFRYCSFANLDEPLIRYRTHNNQESIINIDRSIIETNKILKNLLENLGIHLDNSTLILHNKIFSGADIESSLIVKVLRHLICLRSSNIRTKVFEHKAFNEFLKSNWRRIMIKCDQRFLYMASVLLFFRPINLYKYIDNHLLSIYFQNDEK